MFHCDIETSFHSGFVKIKCSLFCEVSYRTPNYSSLRRHCTLMNSALGVGVKDCRYALVDVAMTCDGVRRKIKRICTIGGVHSKANTLTACRVCKRKQILIRQSFDKTKLTPLSKSCFSVTQCNNRQSI